MLLKKIDKIILQHALLLKGFNIEKLAICLNKVLPSNLHQDKGIIGKLIELWFFINPNNKLIDLPNLGIEIKTIILTSTYKPINKVFISNAKLLNNQFNLTWETSPLRQKIKKILWIIIIKNKLNHNYKYFSIKNAYFWYLSKSIDKILKLDWLELMNIIILGKIHNHLLPLEGEFLCLQRKSNKQTSITTLTSGKLISTYAYGFYFTKKFINLIFKQFNF